MKKKKSNIIRNGGYSLIELVVTILMSGIIVAAIAGFLTTGLRHYRVVSAETTVQTEAQVVELFITELFQESTDFEAIPSTKFPAISDPTAVKLPEGSVVNYAVRVERGGKNYILAWIGDELRYAEVEKTTPGAGGAAELRDLAEQLGDLVTKNKEECYLGQYVTEFELRSTTDTFEEASKNGQIYMDLKFEVDGKVYESTATVVSLRNTIKN